MPLRIADVFRDNIVTVPELLSDGYSSNSIYLSTVLSTTSATQIITVDLPADDVSLLYEGDYQVNSGDIIYLYGTLPGGIADGYYTINTVLTDTSFLVNEPLADSTDGYIQFRYTSGASNVGFDPTNTVHVTANTVQKAIEQLDGYVSGGACDLTPAEHEVIRQLVHLADGVGGPFEGFLSGSYRTITATPTLLTPTYICWWTSVAQVAKIADKTVVYNGVLQPTIIQWQAYNIDGVSVLATVTDTVTYSGVFETSRIRTVVDYNGICDICCITVDNHAAIRQLIHLADGVGGPFEGFASGSYRETIYPINSPFESTEVWYTDPSKTQKIVEHTIVRNSINMPTTITWMVYDVDGVTVLSTVSDSITYTNNIFETSRTRTVS